MKETLPMSAPEVDGSNQEYEVSAEQSVGLVTDATVRAEALLREGAAAVAVGAFALAYRSYNTLVGGVGAAIFDPDWGRSPKCSSEPSCH